MSELDPGVVAERIVCLERGRPVAVRAEHDAAGHLRIAIWALVPVDGGDLRPERLLLAFRPNVAVDVISALRVVSSSIGAGR